MSEPLWDGVREGCGTCEFGGPATQHGMLECRRHPPVMLVVSYPGHNRSEVEAHRPWMAREGWCGEYKRKKS